MNRLEMKELKKEICNIKKQNVEEIMLMMQYCLTTYMKSLMTFGFQSAVTKDVVHIWKEFHDILVEERSILYVLLQYKDLEDLKQVSNLLDSLDKLNEDTISYYYETLDDIEVACEMKIEVRAKRKKKTFETLIETKNYHKQVCALLLNMDDIKIFLNYSPMFWQYIEKRIIYTDDCFFHGVNEKIDENDCLVDMKIFVPIITNLQTALITIHEFKHAYDLYQILGKPLDKDTEDYEKSARDLEEIFAEKYMVKKYQHIFGKVE